MFMAYLYKEQGRCGVNFSKTTTIILKNARKTYKLQGTKCIYWKKTKQVHVF